MPVARHFDTVVFEERDNARMLFFARTTAAGDIEEYLLLTHAGTDAGNILMLEVNEQQEAGNDLITEATLTGNVLTLAFVRPVAALENETEALISYDDSAENRASIEAGVFAVLGDKLTGGHA